MRTYILFLLNEVLKLFIDYFKGGEKMHYFLDGALGEHGSGIEHAIFNRIKIFRDHSVDSKIVTVYSNANLHLDLLSYGFKDNESLNMFDFFQETLDVESKSNLMDKYINDGEYKFETKGDQGDHQIFVIQKGDTPLRLIQISKATQNVEMVVYFKNEKRQYADVYDSRGFLSYKISYDEFNTIKEIEYFDVNQDLKIKQMKKKNGLMETNLPDYRGKSYSFEKNSDFIAFFLNEIASHDEDFFYVDRLEPYRQVIAKIDQHVKLIGMIHSDHTDGIIRNQLNPFVDDFFINPSRYDALVVSTQRQLKDIRKILTGNNLILQDIPVAFVENEIIEEDFKDREKNKIIAVARLSSEKRLDLLIKSFSIVKEQIPDASLDIYGSGSLEEAQKLFSLRKELKLTDSINFKGYKDDLTDVFNHAKVMVSTSQIEGFGIAILEGLSHGVPVISSDIHYGPSDMIKNNENGYLVNSDDPAKYSAKIIDFLNSSLALQQKMSENAYHSVKKFSENHVWEQWQHLAKEVAKTAPKLSRPNYQDTKNSGAFTWHASIE